MSLKVWLPLNGDNKNQGLLDIIPTNLGTVSYLNDGKIGKCLSAGKGTQTSNGISYNNNLVNILGTQFSCSIWVRPLGNHVHYNGTFISSGNWNGKCWAFGVSQDNTKVDIFSKSYNRYIDCVVPVNQWTHLVCTSDNGLVKLYKNGEYIGQSTQSTTLDSDAANFCVGRETYASGYFSFNGNINDVRIYNHVLSVAEIKELSKGLVVHYKLESFNTNLYDFQSIASKWTADGATKVDYIDNEYGNVLKVNSSSGSKRIYRGVSNIWKQGQVYTVSFLAKADSTASCDMSRSIVDFSPSFTLTTEWKRYIGQITSTTTADGGTLSFRITTTGVNVYITQIKLELGSVATPYTPGSGDPDYNKLGYNDSKIIDSSGYGYNGVKNGTLTVSTDTPRNSLSTNFNGTNSYIEAEPLPIETKTISIWLKTSWSKPSSGYRLAVHDKNTGLAIGFSSSGMFITYVGSGNGGLGSQIAISSMNYVANQWNHIAIVKTGDTTRDIYVNGVKKTPSGANYWGGDLNKLDIGCRHLNGSYSQYFDGQLSDFRAYATALSANDILELYQVGGKIDNKSNISSYELVEDTTNRELLSRNYSVYGSTTNTYSTINEDGELYFNKNGGCATDYIPINPSGKTYYYDYTISVATGNKFYIGFERYDANKTPRSNNACVYTTAIKPTSDIVKQRYRGTVNLSTDTVNPCAFIRLRVLNAWSGTDSSSTKLATIHQISLREVSTLDKTQICKTGQLKTDMLREFFEGNASLEKTGTVNTLEYKEI